MQCQMRKTSSETKRRKPQNGRMSVRNGRWNAKRDDTAIELARRSA